MNNKKYIDLVHQKTTMDDTKIKCDNDIQLINKHEEMMKKIIEEQKHFLSDNCDISADKCKSLLDGIDGLLREIEISDMLVDPSNPTIFLGSNNIKSEGILNIKRFVNNTYDGKVFDKRDLNKLQNKTSSPSSGLEPFLQKKVFNDIFTDAVSSQVIFTDSKQKEIFLFQYLVNNLFNKAISKYIEAKGYPENSIIFLYKGGTTIQIIYKKYKDIFKNNLFIEKLADFFKRSDSDYAIYIDKFIFTTESQFNAIVHDMNVLSHNLLNLVSDILSGHRNNCILDLGAMTKEKLREVLQNCNKKLLDDRLLPPGDQKLTLFKNIDKFIGTSFNEINFFDESPPYNFEVDYLENIDDPDGEDIPTINKNTISKKSKLYVDTSGTVVKKTDFFKRYGYVPTERKNFYLTSITQKDSVYPKLINIKEGEPNGLFTYFNETNYYQIKNTDNYVAFVLHRLKINAVLYFKTKDGKYGFFNSPSELIDISITTFVDYKTNDMKFSDHFKLYRNINNGKELRFYSFTLNGFILDIYKSILIEANYPWEDVKYDKKIKRVLFLILILINNKYSNIYDFLMQFLNYLNTPTSQNYEKLINFDFVAAGKKYKLKDQQYIFELIEFINVMFSDVLIDKPKFNNFIKIIKELLMDYEEKKGLMLYSKINQDIETVPYMEKYLKYKNKYLNFKKQLSIK